MQETESKIKRDSTIITVMKPSASEEAVKRVTNPIESKGLQVHLSENDEVIIVDVVGNKTKLIGSNIEISEGVDKVVTVTEPYKLVNKKFHPEDPVIPVGNTHIGPGNLTIMAGPCAVKSKEQLMETAFTVKRAGVTFLRDGTYRPKTPPYSFQGLEEERLKYTKEAHEATGLNVICEVTSQRAIEATAKYVGMLQVRARNIQNFELLGEAGRSEVPVLLKHGLTATIDKWLGAAEYIVSEGDPNVMLYERGTRIFETTTGNTLDISTVPVPKTRSHLPIIVDPSHATGVWAYVEPLARCAVAVGTDGLMVEVHPCPEHTLSDGSQLLAFKQFGALTKELVPFAKLAGGNFGE